MPHFSLVYYPQLVHFFNWSVSLQIWKYACAQVIFDSDPAPVGRPVPAQLEEMSQAMIR